MYNVCTKYMQCMYNVCTVYVQCIHNVCTMYVQCTWSAVAFYIILNNSIKLLNFNFNILSEICIIFTGHISHCKKFGDSF
jgi:hypothetical protein